MSVDTGLAVFSDRLFLAAVIVYGLAMLAYAAEAARRPSYARAALADSHAVAPDRVLVGVGASGSTLATSADEAGVEAPRSDSRWERTGRAAVALTVLGWLLHGASMAARGAAEGRVPLGNMFEFATAGAFAITTTYLLLLVRQRVRWLGVLVMLAVVLMLGLAGTVLYTSAGSLVPALQSYWLWIHVTAAVISMGVLTIGSAAAALYLVRVRYDRQTATGLPRGVARLGRFVPDAQVLDRTAYRVIAFAFPLWTFAVIAGAIWAEAAWGRYWGWDPKETWAFITWVIYACYLHARSTAGWRGTRSAWIAQLGFAAFLFNFFGVNIAIVGLHSYAGI